MGKETTSHPTWKIRSSEPEGFLLSISGKKKKKEIFKTVPWFWPAAPALTRFGIKAKPYSHLNDAMNRTGYKILQKQPVRLRAPLTAALVTPVFLIWQCAELVTGYLHRAPENRERTLSLWESLCETALLKAKTNKLFFFMVLRYTWELSLLILKKSIPKSLLRRHLL